MEWGNLRNWLGGDLRSQEARETRALWDRTEATWRASKLGQTDYGDLIRYLVRPMWQDRDPLPSGRLVVALCVAAHDLLLTEHIEPIEPDWPAIDGDAAVGVRFREVLRRRERWASEAERRLEIVARELGGAFGALLDAMPAEATDEDGGDALFEAPLIDTVAAPAEIVWKLMWSAYDPVGMRLGLFEDLREILATNVIVASGFSANANLEAIEHKLVYPPQHRDQTPSHLVEAYLARTPFKSLLETPVPFRVPTESRFEHAHVIGGTGHGKTQLLQRMIHADLVAAQSEKRSVVVIDSQGDLIGKLTRLALFDPEDPNGLADRLVLIDPGDVEFPAALNLFDAHLDRVRSYGPADRERVLNGVIELYELFFGAMLGAELTQKQGVIFRYLARLMLAIPGATIHTLMQLMEDGRAFKPHMAELEGSARHFFATEFFHASFAATKKQILKRLWGVLSTPAFERMFAQERNKLDLFEALNDGKIILISTAKDLLKAEGSALFGRFFIAMLAQAALERSTIPLEKRTPTFVYVDEAQEYFDDSIETILNQARKYRVGLTLAHQTLDQLSPRLRAALHANTSLKCVGGVSSKDARALADELHTRADFIESMRRRKDRTEFAVWLKQRTPHALRMTVPLGHLERQPILSEEAYAALLAENRSRHCGTLADVLAFDAPALEPEQPRPPRRPADSEAPSPVELGRSLGQRAGPMEDRRPPEPPLGEDLPRGTPPSRGAHVPPTLPVRASRPPPPAEPGKGGPQHRYVQHLVKGLAEERGFRAVIEEAVSGGQVDVGLHRGDLAIACEISVTSTAPYEARNVAKCLAAGFTHVLAVAADAKRLRTVEKAVRAVVSDEAAARVVFLTPDGVADALDAFAPPLEEATIVRGYKVKVSRTFVSEDEAGDRRATVARVIAQSLHNMPKGSGS